MTFMSSVHLSTSVVRWAHQTEHRPRWPCSAHLRPSLPAPSNHPFKLPMPRPPPDELSVSAGLASRPQRSVNSPDEGRPCGAKVGATAFPTDDRHLTNACRGSPQGQDRGHPSLSRMPPFHAQRPTGPSLCAQHGLRRHFSAGQQRRVYQA